MKKIALITGATRGLGAHLAARFWEAGWDLLLVVRGSAEITSLSRLYRTTPAQAVEIFACDLGSPVEVEKLCEQIQYEYQSLDVLINNAAIQGEIGPFAENNFSSWANTIQVNLLAPAALCRGLIGLLVKGNNPSIINLSGGGAAGPRENFSAYAASKAALVRFSETLAEELKPFIKVNCIAPGAMKTKMLEEVLNKPKAAGDRELSAVKRVLTEGGASMDKVADLALFLSSSESDGISGKLISSIWDNWVVWPQHLDELSASDLYTLRRIVGKDRGLNWGDK